MFCNNFSWFYGIIIENTLSQFKIYTKMNRSQVFLYRKGKMKNKCRNDLWIFFEEILFHQNIPHTLQKNTL